MCCTAPVRVAAELNCKLGQVVRQNRDFFRAMTPTQEGLPSVGPSKRSLGALPSETEAANGTFGPGTGGMSVSPDSPWYIPNHRRPRWMGRGATGPAQDGIFGIRNEALQVAELAARLDPNNPAMHAFVEPLATMTYKDYITALARTQTEWRRLWPQDLA